MAASRAIDASPTRWTCGTRRSSAATNSRRLRRTVRVIASTCRVDGLAAATRSICRRISCSASSSPHPGSLPSSRSPTTGTRGTMPARCRWMSKGTATQFSSGLQGRALVRAGGQRAAGLRKAVVRHSVYAAAPLSAVNTRILRLLYSGSRHTALSPPAFEQCPRFSWVRADRPTSAIDRSAHERSFEYPSLELQSRHARACACYPSGEGAATCRPVSLAGARRRAVPRARGIPT
jgi:hypothetical protein